MAQQLNDEDDDNTMQLSQDEVNKRSSVTAKTTKFTDLHGYLKKKSRHDRWQKRWFEANDHYLTYYKSPQSEKLLACIDLYQTGTIQLATADDNVADESGTEFSLELGDRFYIIKAETRGDAKRWVEGLMERKKPKAAPAARKPKEEPSPTKNEGRFTSFMASPDGSSSNPGMKEAIDAVREAQEEAEAEAAMATNVKVDFGAAPTATVEKAPRAMEGEAPKACCAIS